MSDYEVPIAVANGPSMIQWTGKEPLRYVKGLLPRLVEVFDPRRVVQSTGSPTYEALESDWHNLLFHGDNKDVLATLLQAGFGGRISLIYLDPPFKSGADYVREIRLRGMRGLGHHDGDQALRLQQTMYFDNWNKDHYLQFMYERLILLKELLNESGCIFVHVDYHVGHYLKLIMDEVFGEENFRNEIIVKRVFKNLQHQFDRIRSLPQGHDVIFFYTKNPTTRFKPILVKKKRIKHPEGNWKDFWSGADRPTMRYNLLGIKPTAGQWKWSEARARMAVRNYETYLGEHQPKGKSLYEHWMEDDSKLEFIRKSPTGKIEHWIPPSEHKFLDTVWGDIPAYSFKHGFRTEKNEQLLERIMAACSEPGDMILDCFVGSGTTAVVAQKLGRRWIACDLSRGAIQITSKRLQRIIHSQIDQKKERVVAFSVYKVNDYDLSLPRTEAIELAVGHIGIKRTKTDPFFFGRLGSSLVKIVDFNHPLGILDLQLVENELKRRAIADRNVTILCLGKELAVDSWIEKWNKASSKCKIRVIDLRTDRAYRHLLAHAPLESNVRIERSDERTARIVIDNFASPRILKRLDVDYGNIKARIPDFRSMIDAVLIDNNYDGKTFRIISSDVPRSRHQLIKAQYEIEIPESKTQIAIKIIDILGGEGVISKEV
ncbi:MAG: site-specific DNA-methyltransferase [Candidatus Thorarchaeota archaeon]|nr:site-specific DNA-methyltransferase [Candidatus Thorarchaeota archaeon]